MEDAAAAISAAFGNQRVSTGCASSLRELLPGSLFLRASVRCGKGLFVSGDLLQPGNLELSIASLKNSLAGVAMAQGRPVVVAIPASQEAPAAAQVLCTPVGVPPARSSTQRGVGSGKQRQAVSTSELASALHHHDAAHSAAPTPPLFVGALMVGVSQRFAAPPQLWQALDALAAAAAPYFLLLGLTKAADMAEVLKIRAADCSCCPEDALQDLPLEACTPQLSPKEDEDDAAGAQGAYGGGALCAEHAEALHHAATVALARQSSLSGAASPTPPMPPAAVAGRTHGEAGSSSRSSDNTAAAAEAEKRGRWSAESEDPKAAMKQQRAAAAASAATAAAAVRARPAPADALLRYVDSCLEARFAAAYNSSLLRGDALFAITHLAAALCFAVLQPNEALGSGRWQAFVAALTAPLVLMVLNLRRYCRHREALVAVLLLVHALLLRHTVGASLLRSLPAGPGGALAALPWTMRATGGEAAALFAFGFKLRFCRFIPMQALCLALIMPALMVPCPLALPTLGPSCLPRFTRMAALVLTGLVVPAVAVYKSEVSARRRFLMALREAAAA